MRNLLHYFWSDRRIGLAAAIVLAAGAGLLAAWLAPRGPITTTDALLSMIAVFLLGGLAGLLMGSRWALLVTPVAFVGLFELGRMGVEGPMVDRVHLDSFYGIVAFVLGRGLEGLLILVPMVVGSAYGVWMVRRLGNGATPRMGTLGRALTAIVTLAWLGLAILLARPATTAPIPGEDGAPLPGSVAELISVPIGDHEQSLMIRGRRSDKPVLLYLAGGPGGTDIGAVRRDVTLEQEFVVVVWDQRGSGKSYPALEPTETLTLDQLLSDTIEVTNYLRDRFDEEKIYLVGNSWGTTLGVLAVQQHPELFHAFVGTGQMVSQRETDIMFWEDTLAWADRTGNATLAGRLRRNGPPPYDQYSNYEYILFYEHDWNAYPELNLDHEMPGTLFVPEYSWMERLKTFPAVLDSFFVLYPQLQDIDFRTDVPRLELPFYMVLGEHEARGRAVLANEWFDQLDAPVKERIIFDGAGHRPLFDQPGRFAELMSRIKQETYDSR